MLLIVYDLAVKESDPAMECEEYKGNLVKDGFATMDDAMDRLLAVLDYSDQDTLM